MKIEIMPYGIELIAETENDEEILNLFHMKGVRITGYDIANHKMVIEKKLESPVVQKYITIEYDKCIQCLVNNITIDDFNKLKEIVDMGDEAYSRWCRKQHIRYGMYVRNILRDNGFMYSDTLLDFMWCDLLKSATNNLRKLKEEYIK